MARNRWSLAALVLAPLLALAACNETSRVSTQAEEEIGPAQLDEVPLQARALSGAVQAQDDVAALLAPEPLLVAPGQILVGARVGAALDEAASAMGMASNFVRSLRSEGEEALERLPEEIAGPLRLRAETEAADMARLAVRDQLGRLGVQGAVNERPGGLIEIDLRPGASPTALSMAQQGAVEAAGGAPVTMEWNETDRCPRFVTQGQLENDLALAMRCTIQRLRAANDFEFVEPNYVAASGFSLPPRQRPQSTPQQQPAPAPNTPAPAPVRLGGMPNDPLLALQWHYRARGTGEGQSPGGAGFTAFWDSDLVGARDVRVAILDTGLDLSHPEISRENVVSGADFISNPLRAGDGDGVDADANDAGDLCGSALENSYHGTHVAGTVGAATTNDRVGVAGGAWNVTIVPVRVLGRCGGELADIVSGIRWAAGLAPAIGDNGEQIVNQTPADIINMSLTIQAPCPASLQAAIDAAAARDVIVVVAAGNKADLTERYAPANCNNVLVVGSGDARGELAFYSNFGPQVDLIAPGGDLFADNDHDGRPDGVLSTRATQTGCYDPVNRASAERCYYSFQQGTSMAAPHVSAALALLAAQTGLRGAPLRDALMTRALAPHPAEFARITCARSRNAIPVSGGAEQCDRPSGRGALDLARALQ